jgi:hypothetical protein
MNTAFSHLVALFIVLTAVVAAYGTGSRASRAPIVIAPLPGEARMPAYEPLERVIKRDPFVGAPSRPHANPPPDASFDADGSALDFVAFDAPPDPPPIEGNLILKATIVGEEPVAYLASGSTMRIVRVGDLIGERQVVAIDARGVRLSGGMRLELESSSAPRISPSPRLRARALRQPDATRKAPAPSSSASLPPAASPTTLIPATPAPLPTIRFGAYPLGSRPTPDPGAPTAFPYPYPYPPK